MKTNLINLMTLVKEQEMEFKDSCYLLASYSKNRNAIEVTNQQTEFLEDNTQIFSETMNKILKLEREINKNKAIIFEKNNSLTLPNGDTIQKTLNIISNKKILLRNLEPLVKITTKKERVTEVNNSYWIKTFPAFDMTCIKLTIDQLKSDILGLEFEISKLNSEEFEI